MLQEKSLAIEPAPQPTNATATAAQPRVILANNTSSAAATSKIASTTSVTSSAAIPNQSPQASSSSRASSVQSHVSRTRDLFVTSKRLIVSFSTRQTQPTRARGSASNRRPRYANYCRCLPTYDKRARRGKLSKSRFVWQLITLWSH